MCPREQWTQSSIQVRKQWLRNDVEQSTLQRRAFLGLSRRGGLNTSRWDPTFSAAVGAAINLIDRLGITGEFRLRGHETRFTGTTSEISAGLVWRVPSFLERAGRG